MTIQEFLKSSYTAFHTTENCKKMLKENNFTELTFSESWKLKEGGKYFITKNQSSIIAFVIGNLKNYSFNIAEAHTDSPCLRVKGKELVDSIEGKRLNVEVYGGLLRYTMLDIPLKIAGRVMINNNNKIVGKLVESSFNVNIPSLAIHQNPGVNESLKLSVQNDMLPLVGEARDVYSLFGVKENVLDADLFVVPSVEPYFAGANNEYLCSPRIDNLTSAYAVIDGITKCNPKVINIACCFDNEEIGSRTKQGADSSFLYNVLQFINDALEFTKTDFVKACETGLMLSIDNSHAVHPAHPEKSDILEKPHFKGGIVIKHHTNYSTDAYSSALVKNMLNKNYIKYQDFYCNSDMRCGSTLGLLSSSLLSMNSCDIGLAQLAMHSAIETVAYADIAEMTKAVKAFFETKFDCNN